MQKICSTTFSDSHSKVTNKIQDESVTKYLKNFPIVAVAQSVARLPWNLATGVRTPRRLKPFSCLGRHLGYSENLELIKFSEISDASKPLDLLGLESS